MGMLGPFLGRPRPGLSTDAAAAGDRDAVSISRRISAELRRLMETASLSPAAAASVDKPGRGRPRKGPSIPIDEIEQEINDIRKELSDLKLEGKTMEVSERIQIVRTRAALIERVLGMKERVADVKQFHAFVTTVINIMETELPAKGRDTIIEQLRQYAEK